MKYYHTIIIILLLTSCSPGIEGPVKNYLQENSDSDKLQKVTELKVLSSDKITYRQFSELYNKLDLWKLSFANTMLSDAEHNYKRELASIENDQRTIKDFIALHIDVTNERKYLSHDSEYMHYWEAKVKSLPVTIDTIQHRIDSIKQLGNSGRKDEQYGYVAKVAFILQSSTSDDIKDTGIFTISKKGEVNRIKDDKY